MHPDPLAKFLICLSSTLFACATVNADTALTYTDTAGDKTRTTHILIQDNKVRMGEINQPIYSLYDHDQKKLYTVNSQTRQYIDSSLEKMAKRTKHAVTLQNAMKAQMQAQMAQLTPEQQKMVQARLQQEKAMLKTPAPVIHYQDTGRSEKVLGINCKIININYNTTPGRSICQASEAPLPAGDSGILLSMFEYMDKVAVQTAKLQGFVAQPESNARLHKDGLAIRIQALPQGPRSELSGISTNPLDKKLFALPAGYSELEPLDAAKTQQ